MPALESLSGGVPGRASTERSADRGIGCCAGGVVAIGLAGAPGSLASKPDLHKRRHSRNLTVDVDCRYNGDRGGGFKKGDICSSAHRPEDRLTLDAMAVDWRMLATQSALVRPKCGVRPLRLIAGKQPFAKARAGADTGPWRG